MRHISLHRAADGDTSGLLIMIGQTSSTGTAWLADIFTFWWKLVRKGDVIKQTGIRIFTLHGSVRSIGVWNRHEDLSFRLPLNYLFAKDALDCSEVTYLTIPHIICNTIFVIWRAQPQSTRSLYRSHLPISQDANAISVTL